MPEQAAEFFSQQPEVATIKEISRSTFYRIQREDARRFWAQVFEDAE
jgi:hypothetical protein